MQTRYQDRLISRLRDWSQKRSQHHEVALVPPGLLSEAGFSLVLDALRSEFELSPATSGAGIPDPGMRTPLLVVMGAKNSVALDSELADFIVKTSGQPIFWLAEYPFWCDLPGLSDRFSVSLDNRFFRYDDAEMAELLQANGLGTESSQALTPHELRTLGGAWPGLSDAAVAEISQLPAGSGSESSGWPAAYSIARLDAVRRYFAEHWLPLVTWRYAWLRELCVLPLITMDLLVDVFHDAAARECVLMGWIERCPGRVGDYRPEPVLDQLLRAVGGDCIDVGRIEAAIGWYQRHGCPAEAIESAAFLGMPLEKLQQIIQQTVLGQGRHRSAVWLPGSQGGAMTGAAARVAAGAETPAMAERRTSLLAGTAPLAEDEVDFSPSDTTSISPSAAQVQSPTTGPLLRQVLQAIGLPHSFHWAEVSDAVTAAVATGAQRQQVNRLVEFVDAHLRPLLNEPGTPLTRTIRNLKHSAPAKATLVSAADRLNFRELQILQSMCDGCSNQEISERLDLKVSTVKWYGTRIFEKLGVRNRTQAALKARRLKLVD